MQRIRYGMIGGGRDAFIGAVHRAAARLDDGYVLTAGALSSSPEKAIAAAEDLGIPRPYRSWEQMMAEESALPASERIQAVVIVTPNHMHAHPALAAIQAGFHVICDKPLCLSSQDATELSSAVRTQGGVFAVTYNYSGYPMVKQAKHLVRIGRLGPIRKVIVEYNQGWLATKLEETGQKQADWRTDPARAGVGGAIGDIGSHAEQLVNYITGLEINEICADLTSFVPGRMLDDDANVLLRFKEQDGTIAKGILAVSQIMVGSNNHLRIRVCGQDASLDWQQEHPDHLLFTPIDGPDEVYHRGTEGLCAEATDASRIPPGHPEAFIEAFANVYRGARQAMLGERATLDFPTIEDGARGVRFIETVVESARTDLKWTLFRTR